MKVLNMKVEGCVDCRCESMTRGMDARIFCNYESKDSPRSVLVMSTVEKAREIMFGGCKLINHNRCCRCLGSGKVYKEAADTEIQCDMCHGSGTI